MSPRPAAGLESLPVSTLLDLLADGGDAAVGALRAAAEDIEAVVDDLVDRWQAGGRLVYVGAGTSGRIGVLDAAECGPTFGADPERVQAVLAGGPDALRRPVEGAEDDEAAGRAAIDERAAGPLDLVVGVSASGTTPFTCAALERARERGSRTAAITGSRDTRLARAAHRTVALEVGEEVVLGSTRLAAGTAQKLACNALTTAAFVRLGRVRGREMVAVRPSSAKLRRRAVEILGRQLDLDSAAAAELLAAAGDDLPRALVMGAAGVDREAASDLLDATAGDVPRALERARGRRI